MSQKKNTRRSQEEVKKALIDAGIKLFAQRGISAVTVRDLAEEAGVNHSMLFRYFGNKEALVQAVFETMFEHMGMGMTQEPDSTFGEQMLSKTLRAIIDTPDVWRLLTYASLDNSVKLLRKVRNPYMKETLKRLAERQDAGAVIDTIDPRVLLTSGLAMGLGWLVFQNLLSDMTGLKPKDREWVEEQADQLWAHALRPDTQSN